MFNILLAGGCSASLEIRSLVRKRNTAAKKALNHMAATIIME